MPVRKNDNSKKDNRFDAKRYTQCLIDKRLRQGDIAKMMGVSRVTARNWQEGIKKPSPNRVQELARILEVDIEYLTGDSEYKTRLERFEASIKDEDKSPYRYTLSLVERIFKENGYRKVDDFPSWIKPPLSTELMGVYLNDGTRTLMGFKHFPKDYVCLTTEDIDYLSKALLFHLKADMAILIEKNFTNAYFGNREAREKTEE